MKQRISSGVRLSKRPLINLNAPADVLMAQPRLCAFPFGCNSQKPALERWGDSERFPARAFFVHLNPKFLLASRHLKALKRMPMDAIKYTERTWCIQK